MRKVKSDEWHNLGYSISNLRDAEDLSDLKQQIVKIDKRLTAAFGEIPLDEYKDLNDQMNRTIGERLRKMK